VLILIPGASSITQASTGTITTNEAPGTILANLLLKIPKSHVYDSYVECAKLEHQHQFYTYIIFVLPSRIFGSMRVDRSARRHDREVRGFSRR